MISNQARRTLADVLVFTGRGGWVGIGAGFEVDEVGAARYVA